MKTGEKTEEPKRNQKKIKSKKPMKTEKRNEENQWKGRKTRKLKGTEGKNKRKWNEKKNGLKTSTTHRTERFTAEKNEWARDLSDPERAIVEKKRTGPLHAACKKPWGEWTVGLATNDIVTATRWPICECLLLSPNHIVGRTKPNTCCRDRHM